MYLVNYMLLQYSVGK